MGIDVDIGLTGSKDWNSQELSAKEVKNQMETWFTPVFEVGL